MKKLLSLVALSLFLVLSASTPALASPNDCKPDDIPRRAGTSLADMIDPRPEGEAKTMYGEYGWTALQWSTCDLGSGALPGTIPPEKVGTVMDTGWGNAGLQVAGTVAGVMTQIHEMVANPTRLMRPVDDQLTGITAVISEVIWSPWAPVIIVCAAVITGAWGWRRGQTRRYGAALIAILIACGVVYAMSTKLTTTVGTDSMDQRTGKPITQTKTQPVPVAVAQSLDLAAADIVGTVDQRLLESQRVKGASPEESRGAVLYDLVLYRLWLRGAVGTMDPNSDLGKAGADAYKASSVNWTDTNGVDKEARQKAYAESAEKIQKIDSAAYEALRGTTSNRGGLGWFGAAIMIVIACIRIPAEILLLAGLLVVRVVVMLSPFLALAALIEPMRVIATTAVKQAVGAVYNAVVFGIIAAAHTAIVTAVIMANSDLVQVFLLVLAITIVIWSVSKPFRSITRPATGAAVAQAMQHTPGGGGVGSFLSRAASSYLGSRVGSRRGMRDAREDTSKEGVSPENPRYTVQQVPNPMSAVAGPATSARIATVPRAATVAVSTPRARLVLEGPAQGLPEWARQPLPLPPAPPSQGPALVAPTPTPPSLSPAAAPRELAAPMIVRPQPERVIPSTQIFTPQVNDRVVITREGVKVITQVIEKKPVAPSRPDDVWIPKVKEAVK